MQSSDFDPNAVDHTTLAAVDPHFFLDFLAEAERTAEDPRFRAQPLVQQQISQAGELGALLLAAGMLAQQGCANEQDAYAVYARVMALMLLYGEPDDQAMGPQHPQRLHWMAVAAAEQPLNAEGMFAPAPFFRAVEKLIAEADDQTP